MTSTHPGSAARAAAALVCAVLACAAEPDVLPTAEAGGVAVLEPRIPAPPGNSAALYLTLLDRGGRGDRLLGARSDVAGRAALHRSERDGDRVRMRPAAGGLEVPAGGRLVLAPGGDHVMLMQLTRPLRPGDRVTITLHLERAGELRFEAPVTAWPGARAPADS